MAHPAHLAYISQVPFFLSPLRELCGLGFQPPHPRTGLGRMRERRGLGLASGVLSEGPTLPPGSDRLAGATQLPLFHRRPSGLGFSWCLPPLPHSHSA